ncbi:hypothetical protein EDC01DRAFT_710394 [Geopyxis carbonaria]|nr:hypothetical protein EDC01DRAFT_710394 [Geopyxis carbonaria]
MGLFNTLVAYIAPIFLITSPVTSYGDQIRAIHKTRTSRGFSLDTPLIMLLASILRCFYWLGADFDITLLYQSILMIVVQLTLLKVALDNRPSEAEKMAPFAAATAGAAAHKRPYSFWQWRAQQPYWSFLAYFTAATAVLQVLFGGSGLFVDLVGYVALGIEAALPLPQVLANQRRRSCAGFRMSVMASWILGDVMKMMYFLQNDNVGFQFKACAAVQMCLDAGLGVQFLCFGNGPAADDVNGALREKELVL